MQLRHWAIGNSFSAGTPGRNGVGSFARVRSRGRSATRRDNLLSGTPALSTCAAGGNAARLTMHTTEP